MVKIEVNNNILLLDPKQKIRFKLRNQLMFEDVLPKYYSLPFPLPLDYGVNNYVLNYPAEWKNKIKLSRKINCLVYLFGSNNPRNSILNFNTVTEKSAECNIVVDKNVDDIGDKKLRELNLGEYVLENSIYCRYDIRIYAYSPITPSGNFELTINDTLFTAPQSLWTSGTVALINYFVGIINAANIGVVATIKQNNLPGPPEHGGDMNYYLDLIATLPGTQNAFKLQNFTEQLEAYNNGSSNYFWMFPNSGSSFGSTDIVTPTDWVISHLYLMRDGLKNAIDSYNADTMPVTFPIVENIKFIEDLDNYGGFQNSDLFTVVSNLTRLSFITPMPSLHYVMKQVFKALGYDAFGSFFDDSNLKRIILYSNVAADYQFTKLGSITHDDFLNEYYYIGRGALINVHSSIINIANHCPDLTVKEFLTEIRKLFNLRYVYNTSSNKVEVYIIQTKTQNLIQNAKDFSSKMVNKWQLQNPTSTNDTVKLFKFEDDSNDEKTKQLGLLDYQLPLVIDKNAKKEIVPKVSSIGEEVVGGFSMVPVVQIPGVYNNQGSVSKMKLLQYYHRPVVPVGFSIPDWAKIPDTVSYYLMPFAFNKDSYPMFTYTSNWSLRWDTAKGFFAKCWKTQTQVLNDGVQAKVAMTFNNADLLTIEETPYHILHGSVAIWKEIDVELDSENITAAECTYQLL